MRAARTIQVYAVSTGRRREATPWGGTPAVVGSASGELTIESLGAGTRRLVATYVTALDW